MMILLRQLALSLAACLVTASALAEGAHFEAHITGTRTNNTWFLCLPGESGCYSLHAANAGRVFPLESDQIQQAYLLNAHNLHLIAQALPPDCAVSVKEHQTLRVSGNLQTDSHDGAFIQHMHCRLTG